MGPWNGPRRFYSMAYSGFQKQDIAEEDNFCRQTLDPIQVAISAVCLARSHHRVQTVASCEQENNSGNLHRNGEILVCMLEGEDCRAPEHANDFKPEAGYSHRHRCIILGFLKDADSGKFLLWVVPSSCCIETAQSHLPTVDSVF